MNTFLLALSPHTCPNPPPSHPESGAKSSDLLNTKARTLLDSNVHLPPSDDVAILPIAQEHQRQLDNLGYNWDNDTRHVAMRQERSGASSGLLTSANGLRPPSTLHMPVALTTSELSPSRAPRPSSLNASSPLASTPASLPTPLRLPSPCLPSSPRSLVIQTLVITTRPANIPRNIFCTPLATLRGCAALLSGSL